MILHGTETKYQLQEVDAIHDFVVHNFEIQEYFKDGFLPKINEKILSFTILSCRS